MSNENIWYQWLSMPAIGFALLFGSPAIAIESGAETAPTASALALQSTEIESIAASSDNAEVTISTNPAELTSAAPEESSVAIGEPIENQVTNSAAGPVTKKQTGDASVLDEITQYTGPDTLTETDPMGQVTSITQFSDVYPTDWAYQALQSLVERYGCIVGYPDGTFKGQRALTRFEFAAGMNACLDRISELLAASTADLATKEDLATLQRLQEEFAAELAALRGRVDTLETRVTELEANQFSTTTKLNGEVVFGVADTFGGGLEDEDTELNNQTIASGRTRLIFDTSFNGDDRLRARFQAGNFGRFLTTDDAGNSVLGNEARLGFDTDTDNNFQLDILTYLFPVGDNIKVGIAAQVPDFYDFDIVPVVSPFASAGRGAISRFGRFSPIYRTATGSGAGVSFDFDFASLQLAYLAGESGNPDEGSGLFNGDYGALAQLTLTPLKDLTVAFTYVNSYTGTDSSGTGIGFNTGTGSSRARVRIADTPTVTNSYGMEANFRVARFLQLGGWVGYSNVRAIDTGDAYVWNYAGTIGFPDLGKKGSLLGFVIGMQPRLAGTDGFTVSDRRSDPNAGLHIEGFYRFQLNDNISITPGVVWLTKPNHDDNNSDVVLGALRTTFSF